MPFVAAPKLLLGHMQPVDDPVRAAAEAVEGALARRLLAIWEAVGADGVVNAKPVIHDLVEAWGGGRAAIAGPLGIVQKDFRVEFAFDRLAPQNEAAAEDWAAKFVREIGEDVRATINQTTVEGVRNGLGPDKLARNLRESIGLTAAQARAVQNYRSALERNDMAALEYRLRDHRFDVTTEDAVLSGEPLAPDLIDTRVQAYRRRYLSYRANTIARYETLYASNAGAMSAIQSAAGAGILPRGAVKRWLLANDERVCPRCRSIVQMQPQGVALDEPFIWRHGKHSGEIQFPPLHPDCRCTVTYRVL